MWFSFLLCFVLKKTSYKRSNKFPKNRSRFEFFLKNPLEKNKKKTKLVFLCCLLQRVFCLYRITLMTSKVSAVEMKPAKSNVIKVF